MPEQHDEALSEEYAQRRRRHPDGLTWRQRIRANRRSLELTTLIVVLFLVAMLFSVITRNQAERAATRAISAACDFWEPLTSLPVTIPAGSKKPTQLSVKIITGARESYEGQCAGDGHPPLPPPDPSVVKWAALYHLPVAR
jgi:hypothetical protein